MNDNWYKAYFAALGAGYASGFIPENSRGDQIDLEEWAGKKADDSEAFLAKRRGEEEKEEAERELLFKEDEETNKAYAERAKKIRRFAGRFRGRDAHFIVRSIGGMGGIAMCDVLLMYTNGAIDHMGSAGLNTAVDLDELLESKKYTPFPIDDDS